MTTHRLHIRPLSLLAYNGRLNANIAPIPSGLFSAHILPPCANVIFFEMKSPSPVPFSDLLTNLSKRFGKISRSIPLPESLTLTMTSFSTFSVVTAILPSFVNLRALLKRFERTCNVLYLFVKIGNFDAFATYLDLVFGISYRCGYYISQIHALYF